jgi:hypothetical protein
MPSEVKLQTVRAGAYARYSSDSQRDASIDDQVRICRAEVERNGWDLVEVYADPAVSGASAFRPGYQKLLLGASTGAIDVVVAGPVGIENELRSTERVRDRRPGSVLESEEAEQALDARPHRLPIACSFPNR